MTGPAPPISPPPLMGAFFFPEAFQRPAADPASAGFLERLAGWGVNTLFTEMDQYDDAWIALAHTFGFQWFAGVACFSDHARQHAVLRTHPALWPVTESGQLRPPMEWYVGITPTYEWYAEERLRLLDDLIRRHGFDGLMLDFIRWPLHWELECRPGARPLHASFDAHTLERFERFSGLALPGPTPAAQAAWILREATAQWADFKCHVITTFVREAVGRIREVRPDLTVGAFVVPLEPAQQELLAGQRVEELAALTGLVAPMAYHAILHRDIAWVEGLVTQMAVRAPGKILPVLQVDSREGPALGADWGPPISPEEWEAAIARSLDVPGIRGCVGFPGSALEFEGRGGALRRVLHANQRFCRL